MRFKVAFRGVHVGPECVDGSRMRDYAHAHLNLRFKGYICARTNHDLLKYLRHELAHLLVGATHDSEAEEVRWRAGLKSIGGRAPAKQRRPR